MIIRIKLCIAERLNKYKGFKMRSLIAIIALFLTVNLLANEEPIQNDDNSTKYEIYSLNEYLSLGDKKRDLYEMTYSKKRFEYFDKKFDSFRW